MVTATGTATTGRLADRTLEALQVLEDRESLPHSLTSFMRAAWPAREPGKEFIGGWAHDAVCEHLEAVTRGEIDRLLINIPPGCCKSMTVNVFWPAWEWAQEKYRHYRYISAAHEEALTLRDLVYCRQLLESEWYQARWPIRFAPDQNAKGNYENTRRGWRRASSTKAGLTGHRGNRIIVDDPHSVKGADSDAEREAVCRWFSETLPSRLIPDAPAAIVVIMQRVHEADVAGMIIEAENLGYTHLCLPMAYDPDHPFRWHGDPRTEPGELLWPALHPPETVEQLRQALRAWGGTYAEAGQLEQLPVPRGGGMFKVGDFDIVQERPAVARRVRGWDLAASKDGHGSQTASCLLAIDSRGRITIEDAFAFMGSPGEVRNRVASTAEADGPSVEISIPQDPGQAGKAQRADFAAALHGFNVHFSPESGDKAERAKPFAVQVENGNVSLIEASWNKPYLKEMGSFPMGVRDDQVDATSRAYARLIQRKRQPLGSTGFRAVTPRRRF